MKQETAPAKALATLTDQQNRLVEVLSIGSGDQPISTSDKELAQLAGYDTAQNLGNATRSEPVQAALKTQRVARIKTVLAHKALQAIENMIQSDKTPAATRLAAAKFILEQAGHTIDQADAKDKPLAEMTEAELLAFMAKAEKVVQSGGDAPLIKVTP